MTKEEAIRMLKSKMDGHTDTSYEWAETVRMAIQALEQKQKTIQEKQAESEKYQKAFDDGYDNGYAQAKFDYEQELKTEKVIKMRDATPEERESINKYVKSISRPTGVNFWDLEQEPKTGYCKDCKYFEYDSVAKVDGIPLIVAHEICKRWGDGCKTKEDGYCFLFEPQESEE